MCSGRSRKRNMHSSFVVQSYLLMGTLMMAAAVDPEDQIVPIAFALAEGENNES